MIEVAALRHTGVAVSCARGSDDESCGMRVRLPRHLAADAMWTLAPRSTRGKAATSII